MFFYIYREYVRDDLAFWVAYLSWKNLQNGWIDGVILPASVTSEFRADAATMKGATPPPQVSLGDLVSHLFRDVIVGKLEIDQEKLESPFG